ncbi:TetR/AcrR family transcriptional regulator [Brevibacterium spongiae]|uniref:TetR/AcrR family transcriptional regulator n=1 Tax=Brevibacterium spongiae TaxID=2909672 RepID=A0ABY5SMB0_9MICO|nr:TetR/AcrR family transcriptional regulator [Brevibacterium spongiae]UVI35653.1 TetR/AcrR family transcriptional regulator [Brevibacterium spongiae]
MNTDELSPRRRQTRSTLVHAGTSVFAVRGIDGASIEEICEAGGLTRGAFYSNFSSRDDLVLAIIEMRTEENLDRLDETIQRWTEQLTNTTEVPEIKALMTRFIDDVFNEKKQTVAETITEQEIELYCLRVPHLYARYVELNASQLGRLSALVATALEVAGATTKQPISEFLTVIISVFNRIALTAAAGKEMHEYVDIDPSLIVDVLMHLIDFSPCETD